jgi:hypothetical protein
VQYIDLEKSGMIAGPERPSTSPRPLTRQPVQEVNVPIGNILYHVTLNTGHVAETARAEVSQKAIDYLLPFVDNESGQFPQISIGFDIYRPLKEDGSARDGAAIFHIMPVPETSEITYAVCLGCWKADMTEGAWERLREVYVPWAPALRKFGLWKPMADAPPPVPWLGVIILPTIVMLDQDRILMLGDMERCLFWALAEGSAS